MSLKYNRQWVSIKAKTVNTVSLLVTVYGIAIPVPFAVLPECRFYIPKVIAFTITHRTLTVASFCYCRHKFCIAHFRTTHEKLTHAVDSPLHKKWFDLSEPRQSWQNYIPFDQNLEKSFTNFYFLYQEYYKLVVKFDYIFFAWILIKGKTDHKSCHKRLPKQ